jgi:membrane protease YdiL (CAAX protease family)
MKTRIIQEGPTPDQEVHMFRSAAARQAATYTGLVYALTLAAALALPHAGFTPLLALFCPVVSVLLITALGTRRGHRKALWAGIGLRHAGLRSWPVAVLLPIAFLVVSYGAAVLLGIASFTAPGSLVEWLSAAMNLVAGLVVSTALVMNEEIGWRGYLLPRMQMLMSPRRAALTTGFIHGVFHLPLILLTTVYDNVGNRFIVAPVVVATITAAGAFYAWLRDRSGSIWPVAIAHGAVDAVFSLGAASAVTVTPVALAYTAGESGIATFLAVGGAALYLLASSSRWQHNAPLGQPKSTATRTRSGSITANPVTK